MKFSEPGRTDGSRRHRLLAAGFLAVTVLYCLTPVHNGNFFWHLRNGEDILDTGIIRTSDPFTWTRHGETWLQQEWLSEVLMALSWRTLGESGPVLLKTLVILLAVSLTMAAAKKRGAGIPSIVLLGILWFSIAHGRWIARPHVFSILMFSLYLWLMERGTGGTMRSIAVFVPLQVIWTNLHAGFIMGWFLLGIPVLGSIIRKNGREVLGHGAVLATAIMASLLHPNGPGSFTYITDFMSRPLFRKTIREWWSPFHPLYQPNEKIFSTAAILSALLIFTWIMVLRNRRKLEPEHMAALAILSAACILSSRNIDFLAVAAIAWTSPLLKRVKGFVPAMLLAAAAVVPFTRGIPSEFGPPLPLRTGVQWEIYPVELVEFIRENPGLMNARIFNVNGIAGYLEYELGEELPLYMDGRCHLYPENFYAEYLILTFARPSDTPRVMSIFENKGIELAIYHWPDTGESSAYALAANPEWSPVYWDHLVVVYAKNDFLEREGLFALRFEHVDPLDPYTLLTVPFYYLPQSWNTELSRAASPPMRYPPAIQARAALLAATGKPSGIPDRNPDGDSFGESLRLVLEGEDPVLENPGFRILQCWSLAAKDRFEEAVEAATASSDTVLLNAVLVLSGNSLEGDTAVSIYRPPAMVPIPAWEKYVKGTCTPGDSAAILASALFTAGMRERALEQVDRILNDSLELHPWGYSVCGGISAYCGHAEESEILGWKAVSMSVNPYTLMWLGNILRMSGKTEQALEAFDRSLEIADIYIEARIRRADLLWNLGDIEAALLDYRALSALDYLTPIVESRLEWGNYFTRLPRNTRTGNRAPTSKED